VRSFFFPKTGFQIPHLISAGFLKGLSTPSGALIRIPSSLNARLNSTFAPDRLAICFGGRSIKQFSDVVGPNKKLVSILLVARPDFFSPFSFLTALGQVHPTFLYEDEQRTTFSGGVGDPKKGFLGKDPRIRNNSVELHLAESVMIVPTFGRISRLRRA